MKVDNYLMLYLSEKASCVCGKKRVVRVKKAFPFPVIRFARESNEVAKANRSLSSALFSAQPLTGFSSDLGIDGAISAGIFKQYVGDRMRVEIGLS